MSIFLFIHICFWSIFDPNLILTRIKKLPAQDRVAALESLHFPLWIVKDASWFAAIHFVNYKPYLQIVSLVFAIPTLLITFYLIAYSSGRMKKLENLLLGLWLTANTIWMLSELFGLPLVNVSALFFIAGLVCVIPYLTLVRKRQGIE